jgi:hypothetical protein
MFLARAIAASRRRDRYRAEVLADNPVAYWRLSETSGTTAVDEGGAFPGTYIGTPTLSAAGPMPAVSSVQFSGSGQYVSRADNASLRPQSNSFTVEAWFYLDEIGAARGIVSKGNEASADDGFGLYVNATGLLTTRCNGGGGTTNRAAQTIQISAGGWNHAVLVINRSTNTIKGYLNGSDSGWNNGGGGTSSNSISGFPSINNTLDLNIGRLLPTNDWKGRISSVAIYPTALSAERIAAHYAAANP